MQEKKIKQISDIAGHHSKFISATTVSSSLPTSVQARGGWTVEHHESGASFDDVSLVENEWADFDERSGEPVGITELEHQFVKVK